MESALSPEINPLVGLVSNASGSRMGVVDELFSDRGPREPRDLERGPFERDKRLVGADRMLVPGILSSIAWARASCPF